MAARPAAQRAAQRAAQQAAQQVALGGSPRRPGPLAAQPQRVSTSTCRARRGRCARAGHRCLAARTAGAADGVAGAGAPGAAKSWRRRRAGPRSWAAFPGCHEDPKCSWMDRSGRSGHLCAHMVQLHLARLELDSGCCTSHQLELDGEDVEDVLVDVLVDVLADAIEDGLEDGYEDADVLRVVLHALHVLDVDVRDADALEVLNALDAVDAPHVADVVDAPDAVDVDVDAVDADAVDAVGSDVVVALGSDGLP